LANQLVTIDSRYENDYHLQRMGGQEPPPTPPPYI